jgi:signal transduction histidine kinase
MSGSSDAPAAARFGALDGVSDDRSDGAPGTATAQFAARVAHDFNNLLTGVLGNLELLQMRATRQNITGLESYLDGANSAGGRAVAFAARLMVYSGRGAAPPACVPADAILAKFADRATCHLGAGEATLFCDSAQLELAVAELLTNAEEAGGAVVVSSATAGQYIVITIRDSGCGMSEDCLAQACQPFYTTASNGTGRGLGLAIVTRVVRDLGGCMEMQAVEGSGCTVTLKLPRSEAVAEQSFE